MMAIELPTGISKFISCRTQSYLFMLKHEKDIHPKASENDNKAAMLRSDTDISSF